MHKSHMGTLHTWNHIARLGQEESAWNWGSILIGVEGVTGLLLNAEFKMEEWGFKCREGKKHSKI